VDSLSEEIETACNHIRELGTIPLVLIVNSKKADWKRLQPLAADGYLPVEAGKNELTARLKAMHRRFFMVNRLKDDFKTQPAASDKEILPIFGETLTPALQPANRSDAQ
jgi:hypothetical protein